MKRFLLSFFLASALLVACFPLHVNSDLEVSGGTDWWNPDWSHRRRVEIVENSGYNLTNFPVEVTIQHDGNIHPNGTDIRVIDEGIEIPNYVEETNSSHAKVVFEVNLTASGIKDLYVYYSNPSASPPNYELVSLAISEADTGYAIIDNALYIGWTLTVWGGSGPEVTVWTDYKIDFDRNADPVDNSDLITDYGGRKGGIGRLAVHYNQIGLGDYQRYVQTPIYVDIVFANASLRAYKSYTWVETTQADDLFMFSPSWDHANFGLGSEQNIIDGENVNQILPSPPWHYPWNEMYISPVNPEWMVFRDSSSGEVFGSTGFNIAPIYNFTFSAKEGSDWDRCILYDFTIPSPPPEPYDQPSDCRIYWYGDNSNNYTKIDEMATILDNQPTVSIVPDTIIVPDDFATIQGAIDAANEGDTVFVRNGTYYENVVVNKTLTLQGENRNTTMIDGEYLFASVVNVTANNVKFSGFTIQHCSGGGRALWLDNYGNMTFSHNIITGCNEGVRLHRSSGNVVSDNIVQDCYYNTGVGIDYGINNTVYRNTIINNHYGLSGGIDCHGNTFSENTIINNDIGFGTTSYDNKFFHNNFVNNSVHVIASGMNQFDDGYHSEGNYWSDYNGTDSNGDGIGDTPYVINENNQDNYPLMNLYWNPADIDHDLDVDIFDIVRCAGAYGCTPSSPHWNPHCDIAEPYGAVDIFDLVTIAMSYGEEYAP